MPKPQGPKCQVFVKHDAEISDWRLYRDGKRFSRQSDAFRFAYKIKGRWPTWQVAVFSVDGDMLGEVKDADLETTRS